MNQVALLAQNAITTQTTFATAAMQELVRNVEEQQATIARLEEMVRAKDAELEELRPKVVGQ